MSQVILCKTEGPTDNSFAGIKKRPKRKFSVRALGTVISCKWSEMSQSNEQKQLKKDVAAIKPRPMGTSGTSTSGCTFNQPSTLRSSRRGTNYLPFGTGSFFLLKQSSVQCLDGVEWFIGGERLVNSYTRY